MEKCIDGIVATRLDLFGKREKKFWKKGEKVIGKKSKDKYVRGPIPLPWISKAAAIGGKALNLSMALFFLNGFAPGNPITLSSKALGPFNCGVRQTVYKTLAQLEEAGLVKVMRKKGSCPRVQLLTKQMEPKSEVLRDRF